MSNIDKKVLLILLILSMIIGLISPMNSFANDSDNKTEEAQQVNTDPELENSNITAKFVGDKILQSNGDLWEFDENMNVTKNDRNISNCLFYKSLAQDTTINLSAECKLYKNGELKVNTTWTKNETNDIYKQDNTTINNIKDILNIPHGHMLYIDGNNNLYRMDCFEEKIETTLIAESVSNAWKNLYAKDGKTYIIEILDNKLETEEILDEEIIDAFGSRWIVNSKNELLERRYNRNWNSRF